MRQNSTQSFTSLLLFVRSYRGSVTIDSKIRSPTRGQQVTLVTERITGGAKSNGKCLTTIAIHKENTDTMVEVTTRVEAPLSLLDQNVSNASQHLKMFWMPSRKHFSEQKYSYLPVTDNQNANCIFWEFK